MNRADWLVIAGVLLVWGALVFAFTWAVRS